MVKVVAIVAFLSACTGDDAEHVLKMTINPPSGGVSVPRGQLLVELDYHPGGGSGPTTESLMIPDVPTSIVLPTDFTVSFDTYPAAGTSENMQMRVDVLDATMSCVLACGMNNQIYFANPTDGVLVVAPCPQALTADATSCP